MKSLTSVFLAALFAVSVNASADDTAAKAKLTEAQALYDQRADLTKLDAAIAAAEVAATQAQDSLLKYNSLVLESEALYYKAGQQTTQAAKLEQYAATYNKATEAKNVNADWAESYFWYAAGLGKWGETKGKTSPAVLVQLPKLLGALNKLMDPDTKTSDGQLSGEAYEYFGADRIEGWLWFQVPPTFGGSLARALPYLQKAYENGKDNSLNVYYYAKALSTGSADQVQQAKGILDDLLKNNPETYNPKRVPETKQEFNDAKTLRDQLG